MPSVDSVLRSPLAPHLPWVQLTGDEALSSTPRAVPKPSVHLVYDQVGPWSQGAGVMSGCLLQAKQQPLNGSSYRQWSLRCFISEAGPCRMLVVV